MATLNLTHSLQVTPNATCTQCRTNIHPERFRKSLPYPLLLANPLILPPFPPKHDQHSQKHSKSPKHPAHRDSRPDIFSRRKSNFFLRRKIEVTLIRPIQTTPLQRSPPHRPRIHSRPLFLRPRLQDYDLMCTWQEWCFLLDDIAETLEDEVLRSEVTAGQFGDEIGGEHGELAAWVGDGEEGGFKEC